MLLTELNLDRNLYKVEPDTQDEGATVSSGSIVSVPTTTLPSGSSANDINTNSKGVIADRIDSGIISSKQITLGVIPGAGDVYLAAGKTDFNNTVAGFILGIDDSDSDKAKFYIGNVTDYLNWNGTNLTISGAISASSGTIGGFTITSNSLYAGSNSTRIELNTTQGIHMGATTFIDAPFSVALDGSLKSISGLVGGFNIKDGYLYGGIIKTAQTVEAGTNGVIMDALGIRGYDSILGQTFNVPTDGSAPLFSFGNIRESVFEIDTNSIIRTSPTVGDGTANSAGILINDTGIYGIAPNQTPSTANVKILINGTAVFNASIMGGQTDYATGTGYFLGLSAGDYKLSIGNDTNYLRWDGDNLILKGSFDVGAGGIINNGTYTVANLPTSPTVVGFNVPSAYE